MATPQETLGLLPLPPACLSRRQVSRHLWAQQGTGPWTWRAPPPSTAGPFWGLGSGFVPGGLGPGSVDSRAPEPFVGDRAHWAHPRLSLTLCWWAPGLSGSLVLSVSQAEPISSSVQAPVPPPPFSKGCVWVPSTPCTFLLPSGCSSRCSNHGPGLGNPRCCPILSLPQALV